MKGSEHLQNGHFQGQIRWWGQKLGARDDVTFA